MLTLNNKLIKFVIKHKFYKINENYWRKNDLSLEYCGLKSFSF